MKTPIPYYGGKQRLASRICRVLAQSPAQTLYVEPFFGGGAVFFAKEPHKAEVINDKNDLLITFYRVLKKDFPALKREIDATLYSRSELARADAVLKNPFNKTEVEIAHAVWVSSVQSFGHAWGAGWAYSKKDENRGRAVANARKRFTEELSKRLEEVAIECSDALKVIKSRDTPGTLFYLDPPYAGTYCQMYKGYTESDYRALLDACEAMKGCFVLSSYPSALLDEFSERNGWAQARIEQEIAVNKIDGVKRVKTECITANFPFTLDEPKEDVFQKVLEFQKELIPQMTI